MSDLVTRLSVLAEDDGDRYPAHVKNLAEAAASRIAALEAQIAERAGGVKVPIGYALVPVEPTDRMVSAYVAAKPKGAGFNHPRKGDDKKAWFAAHEKKCRERWKAMLSVSALTTEPAAPEERQEDEPRAYIVHAPEDDYYGTGPDRLQFHPLAQHDMDNGYRQTPLYGRPAHELSENTGELIDKMAEAIRGDTTSDDAPWATLSEDRKIGWRGDAERALAVVKHYLTARGAKGSRRHSTGEGQ